MLLELLLHLQILWCILRIFKLIDSVKLGKDGFLPHRDLYSYQFKNLFGTGYRMQPNSTCMIYFSDNKKKLEKEATKILGKYRRTRIKRWLQKIDTDKFSFIKPEE